MGNLLTSRQIGNQEINTGNLADNAVTTDKLGALSVTDAKLADAAVTTAKIAESAVDTDQLNDNAVVANKINDSAVTEGKLAIDAVTADKIAADAVTNAKLINNAVTADKIDDGAVTLAKLFAESVNGDKVVPGSLNQSHLEEFAEITPAQLGLTEWRVPLGNEVEEEAPKTSGELGFDEIFTFTGADTFTVLGVRDSDGIVRGLVPVGPNDPLQYLNGQGAFAVPVGASGYFKRQIDTGSWNGIDTTLVLAGTMSKGLIADSEDIYINGQLLHPGVQYTVGNDNAGTEDVPVEFAVAPTALDVVVTRWRQAVE